MVIRKEQAACTEFEINRFPVPSKIYVDFTLMIK